MAEKEKASTGSCPLSSLEDHVSVEIRRQTMLESSYVNTRCHQDTLRQLHSMPRNAHFGFNFSYATVG